MRPQRKEPSKGNDIPQKKKEENEDQGEEDDYNKEQDQVSKNKTRQGRPPKSLSVKVYCKQKVGHEAANKFITLLTIQYLRLLKLSTLNSEEPCETNWTPEEDIQPNRDRLGEISKKEKRLNVEKIDELAYVITHFASRITFLYRFEIYELMFSMISRNWQQMLTFITSPEGKAIYPYLTLTIENHNYKNRPTDEKIQASLKFFIQRIENEMVKNYHVEQ